MTVSSDQELIERLHHHDTRALSELYDVYCTRVYSLAVAILGDTMAAQEVTQDTFMKVWQNPHLYRREEGRFTGWILTITRRLAIDHLRYENRRSGKSFSMDDDNFPELHDSAQDEMARWRDLKHMMDELPLEQREVIVLAYYRGMSQSDIAIYLDIPLGTVKTRMRLGMDKLRVVYMKIRSV